MHPITTIRWLGYPLLFIIVWPVTEHCLDPDAFLFKECSNQPGIAIPLFIVTVIIIEWLIKKWEKEQNKPFEERKRKAEQEEKMRELESQKRQAAIIDKDKQERLRISRAEIVKKLVSVSNYLTHLTDPAYSEKQSLIKQNLANELAEIIAKYPLADLQALIQNNPEIQKKLHSLNAKFQDHKIENDELQLMLELIPMD